MNNQLSQIMGQMQLQQTDINQANTIRTQMMADRQKNMMEQWKIMKDLQTFQFKTLQETALTRSKVGHQLASAYSKMMLS